MTSQNADVRRLKLTYADRDIDDVCRVSSQSSASSRCDGWGSTSSTVRGTVVGLILGVSGGGIRRVDRRG
jgi:hypothetical protein